MDKTQQEFALELFKLYSGKLTLGQILKTPLAAEYRRLFSDMRKKGYTIEYQRGETPSQNTYILYIPDDSEPIEAHSVDSKVGGRLMGVGGENAGNSIDGDDTGANWRQVDTPCPECGSYYQRNGKCNRCG